MANHKLAIREICDHGPVEETLRRGHIAFGRKQETDGFALLVDGAVPVSYTHLTLPTSDLV